MSGIDGVRGLLKARLLPLLFPFREAIYLATSRQGWQRIRQTPLYANSLYLMANSAVCAGAGFVFWLVVAWLSTPEDVGLAAALISAKALLSFVGGLGLGHGLIRFLPISEPEAPKLINSAIALCGLVSAAVAIIFLIGLPFWSPVLTFVTETPVFVVAFIGFVVASAFSRLLGEVFVAFRRAGFALAQSAIFSILKVLFALLMVTALQVFGIFSSWGLAVLLAIVTSLFLFLPRVRPGYRFLPSRPEGVPNGIVRFSLANYVAEGLWSAPAWILPLMVVNVVGKEANAHFYISWGMAALVFAIPGTVSTSLFAEGSNQEAFLARDMRRGFKAIMVALLPAIAVILIMGDKLLLIFGKSYSLEGGMCSGCSLSPLSRWQSMCSIWGWLGSGEGSRT